MNWSLLLASYGAGLSSWIAFAKNRPIAWLERDKPLPGGYFRVWIFNPGPQPIVVEKGLTFSRSKYMFADSETVRSTIATLMSGRADARIEPGQKKDFAYTCADSEPVPFLLIIRWRRLSSFFLPGLPIMFLRTEQQLRDLART